MNISIFQKKIDNSQNVESLIRSFDDATLINLIHDMNNLYHEKGTTIISDDIFDKLVEELEQRNIDDSDKTHISVGHKVKNAKAVNLPFFMGSMKKIKPEMITYFNNWKKQYEGPYIISEKLDGVSAMFSDGELFTRGNGKQGRNISKLMYMINGIHQLSNKRHTIRGELIITKCDFNIMIDNGIISDNTNPRNTVAGVVNSKNPNENIIKYVKFVAYEVIQPRMDAINQMEYLKSNSILTVNSVKKQSLTIEDMTQILETRKSASSFEIDGIIINDSSIVHPINQDQTPKYAFAFKLPTSEVEVQVQNVVWEISKDLLVKPTVIFTPVSIGGVTIQRATGFNAKFIIENRIGPGTILSVTRSGDVIPYIKSVISSTEPQLPKYTYTFTENKVDIKVDQNSDDKNLNEKIRFKQFQNMIEKLDITGLKKSSIKKLFDNDIRTLQDVFELTKTSLKSMNIESFGDKKIQNLIESIENTKENITIIDLMEASNTFGRGFSKKTLSLIYEKFPNFMNSIPDTNALLNISGIGPETSLRFHKNIPKFLDFIDNNNLNYLLNNNKSIDKVKKTSSGKLKSLKFIFSGPKDKALIKTIVENGGEVVNTISKSVNYLLTQDTNTDSSKKNFAKKHGIEIIPIHDFEEKFGKL